MSDLIWLYLIIGSFFAGMCFEEYKDESTLLAIGWGTTIAYLWPLAVVGVMSKAIKARLKK